jgi:putative FmdB family regulatory protein
MPIYEYGCEKCKRKTEAIQQVGEKRLRICPHCGGKLKKLASAPAIQFKGSGWYVTDYARAKTEEKSSSGSEKTEAPSEKTGTRSERNQSAEKAADEKASGKPESKPAEKKKEGKEKKAAKD